jgi:nucleoside-diphosphate-sugar epimerase
MIVTLSREKHTVTNARRPVRQERSDALRQPMPVVAVTGAASGVGHALTVRLAASPHIKKVIAIDGQRGDIAGVTWRVADVRDPALAGRLTGVDIVVHADFDLAPDSDARQRRAFNVRGAQTVLTAAAAGRVGRVLLVTSAMVYGARPDNQVPLPEGAPLAAEADSSVAGDLLEVEQLARRSPRANPGMAVTVVRPAALVGEPPHAVDTLVTRHFEAPRLLKVKGCAPRWQFCHVDDLASAIELAVAGGLDGDFAVGCDGWLEQEEVEQISGLKSIELPARLTFGTAQRLHRVGVTPASAMDLRYVVYPWVVDGAALRAAGWRPRVSNEAALRVLLDQRQGRHAVAGRRIARKEVTITAAGATGATVAVIGTAAIVRRARRRRT